MRELSMNEVQEVNGGIVFIVLAIMWGMRDSSVQVQLGEMQAP